MPTTDEEFYGTSTESIKDGKHVVNGNGSEVWILKGSMSANAYDDRKNIVGNSQYQIDGDMISIGGINASTKYRGLGSLIIKEILE